MFQLRDATDPWADTADTSAADAQAAGEGVGTKIANTFKSIFDLTPAPTQTPGVTTIRPGVSPLPATKPWYKTPIGIGAILLGAFAGYKIYTRKK